ncbi:MAG: 3-oxoadipate CoA-transferase [Chloroflexi bacterium]|nr:3-oxoadipate CoA-transferase [Chloroflexota bacterium]
MVSATPAYRALIAAVVRRGLSDLSIISNNCGTGERGLAALYKHRMVRRVYASFPAQAGNDHFSEAHRSGHTELVLVPQGTLAERIRAGGAGLGGVLTPTTVLPGAAIVDHATSFALIRGGRLDAAVLGAYQVSSTGDLANWRVGGEGLGSVGGAMDIAIGARNLFVMMRHQEKDGRPKLVEACTYPLTVRACVKRVYTELAVIDVTADGLIVRDLAPGMTREALQQMSAARLG